MEIHIPAAVDIEGDSRLNGFAGDLFRMYSIYAEKKRWKRTKALCVSLA